MKNAPEKEMRPKANLHGPFESFEIVWGGVSTLALCVFVFLSRSGSECRLGVGKGGLFSFPVRIS